MGEIKSTGLLTRLWNAFRNRTESSTPRYRVQANAGGYDAGSTGRRAQGWNASRLGSNTLALANQPEIVARSRDAVRNSALAASAINHFESNLVGDGIVPHFMYPDPEIRNRIQQAWTRWTKQSDYDGQLTFEGQQALLTRELFEAGECFVRFHVSDDDILFVPLQLQLIESEQVPVFLLIHQQMAPPENCVVKSGVIFDVRNGKRVGYRMYREQPFDTTFATEPLPLQFIDVPSEDILHVYKPLRAGQIRGIPQMTSVLALLYDIEGYADSERLRKKLGSMFAFFIQKPNLDEVLPSDPNAANLVNTPGVDITRLEPGTIQELLPGEEIKAPEIPQAGDYDRFMTHELRKFASAVGVTYEMLTGDMTKVNYSSARVALLEFRRAAEQFQANQIISGFCEPVMKRWMREAYLCGSLDLPDDYLENPETYERCEWVAPGWQWVDPRSEVTAYQEAVRSGFISRTMVVRQSGFDPIVIDNQIAEERKREKELGIITDTNANVVLIGRESQPERSTSVTPDRDTEEVSDEDTGSE